MLKILSPTEPHEYVWKKSVQSILTLKSPSKEKQIYTHTIMKYKRTDTIMKYKRTIKINKPDVKTERTAQKQCWVKRIKKQTAE